MTAYMTFAAIDKSFIETYSWNLKKESERGWELFLRVAGTNLQTV